ncbi:MAG TPA: biotin--[acetyl-CoA-carboxylase] ligase [Candidatus Dormibacteraeota bacterium]|nr:biotin--[acetyl-CoA-carboxylase] ligase [Candidatus Dormibacteraeota bacterium]
MTGRSAAAKSALPGFLGVPVERHASIGSTNDEAFRRADEGAPEGLVVVAQAQTAGRGRQGRSWWDTPGASLLFSVLLRPSIPLPQCPLLALALACCVADAGTEATGAALGIKWPNDVLHDGRKLCGVLAESRVSGASSRVSGAPSTKRPAVVVGAGVNVNQTSEDFPAELRGTATSLRIAGGGNPLRPGELLPAILVRLERYAALAASGDGAGLWREVAGRLPKPGSEVAVVSGGRRIAGVVEGITESGALRLREPGRAEATVVSAGELA